jgi:hypothetical protein
MHGTETVKQVAGGDWVLIAWRDGAEPAVRITVWLHARRIATAGAGTAA